MKKKPIAALGLIVAVALAFPTGAYAKEAQPAALNLAPNAKSAVLIDAGSGTVIYEKNSHDRLPPASITKIMTMLLVMEAIDQGKLKWSDKVATSEYAASMGGSQIFLEPGEEMSVQDMLKGIAMASGNDASVAVAEKLAGSEDQFVNLMNGKAKELGMKDTHFANSNGLPVENHYSSAHDIALMSRALLQYPKITQFTGKYQDYLRKDSDHPFWLVNTNKLVRFYAGADGIKTGFTSEARFCLSATAQREGFRVIAVVMGEPNVKTRNAEVTQMLNYAFSQYTNRVLYKQGQELGKIKVFKGTKPEITLVAATPYSVLAKKGEKPEDLRTELVVDGPLKAPIAKGDPVGKLVVYRKDEVVAEFRLACPEDVGKAGWWTMLRRTAGKLFFLE